MTLEPLTHYGFQDHRAALCLATDGERRTSIRLVTCRYCLNILDRFISARVTDLFISVERADEEHPP